MTDRIELLRKALEIDRDGDWDRAHTIVQNMDSPGASWIHAYLHRKEGALGNAAYWYGRARRAMPEYDLQQEWAELYEHFGSD